MLSPDYYRKQAKCCLRVARETSDTVLATRLNALAADFMQAALEVEGYDPSCTPPSPPQGSSDCASDREER
jgi:hypothetical protein